MNTSLATSKSQVRLLFLSPHVLGNFDADLLYRWGLEGNLKALLSRAIAIGLSPKLHCITPQVLGRWSRLLGMQTGRDRYGYEADEIDQIADYYRAVHMMRILSQPNYVIQIAKQGLTLDEFLISNKYKRAQ